MNTHCYVASEPGKPGYCAACADDPRYAADFCREMICEGKIITRVTVEEAQKGLGEYFASEEAVASQAEKA